MAFALNMGKGLLAPLDRFNKDLAEGNAEGAQENLGEAVTNFALLGLGGKNTVPIRPNNMPGLRPAFAGVGEMSAIRPALSATIKTPGPGIIFMAASGSQSAPAAPVEPTPSLPSVTKVSGPRFIQQPTRILQSITDRVNAMLGQYPGLARTVLSSEEYAMGRSQDWLARMQYGNAIEQLAWKEIQRTGYKGLFDYFGGPNNPDFLGEGAAAGSVFDITTPAAIAEHLARDYGSSINLQIITYERPFKFTLFP